MMSTLEELARRITEMCRAGNIGPVDPLTIEQHLAAVRAEGMEEAAKIAYSNAIANEDVDNCCCADAIRSAIQRERAVIEEKK